MDWIELGQKCIQWCAALNLMPVITFGFHNLEQQIFVSTVKNLLGSMKQVCTNPGRLC